MLIKTRVPIAIATLLMIFSPSGMAHASEQTLQEELVNRFLDGYEQQNSLQVLEEIEAVLALEEPPSSVFLPSATIEPLAKTILALEAMEGERDRVRYHIRYGIEQVSDPARPSVIPLSFVQVDRFSLGAAIREEVIEAYGAEHVAPPEVFDAGPHVSWRMITQPVQGTWADIQAVGRTELSAEQAQQMQCLNHGCLSTSMSLDEIAHGEMQATPVELDVPYQVVRAGLLSPAATLAQLTKDLDFSEAAQQEAKQQHEVPAPFLEAVIEVNLAQDSALSAAMRWGELKDDSVAAIWRLLSVTPTGEDAQMPMTYHTEAYECYRGPTFPEDGGLCP